MSNFVWVKDDNLEIKRKNLFLVTMFFWFTWIVFHFTIVYFFWLVLESILLVWIFLWIWNFVALILDIPIWVIQKYFKAKNILIFWNSLMIIISIIFLKFIYFSSLSSVIPWVIVNSVDWLWIIESGISSLWLFLDEWINIILLLITAILYWIIKETYDITLLSYILWNSIPSEYAELISKYNISFWVWALTWIICSWIILAFSIKIAIVILIIIIFLLLFITLSKFDNWESHFDISDIKKLNIVSIYWDVDNTKKYIVQNIKEFELKEAMNKVKIIFLKPIDIKKHININEIMQSSKESFRSFKKVIFWKPKNTIIIWTMMIMLSFGFWDTFVSTFQVEFLNKIISLNRDSLLISQTWTLITWYVLLWLLVIPIFLSQWFFINKSKKYWIFKIVSFWIIISSISIITFWFSDDIIFIMIFWFLNSFWYAAAMPLAQATFSEKYNEDYALKFNLKEIDSNSSAAPMKMLINFANVIWLIFGWIIVWLLWFNWFFKFFWVYLIWIFIYWIFNKPK